MRISLTFFLILISLIAFSQPVKIGKLKYDGGGDWYSNKTALPNLIEFCNERISTKMALKEDVVDIGTPDLFLYPYVYMTGHGNVVFKPNQADNLRKYLVSGGFLHIDDNFGLDQFIRIEMKKVFPELDFVEIPFDHPIYHQQFDFDQGLPKIHEHSGQAPQGFGIIYENRLVCFYSYESDLGNGWEDRSVYNDPQELRLEALKMGANIISYVFTSAE
ncbi:MAG: DUF4159 domain-containing protein [Ekhidna sp.]